MVKTLDQILESAISRVWDDVPLDDEIYKTQWNSRKGTILELVLKQMSEIESKTTVKIVLESTSVKKGGSKRARSPTHAPIGKEPDVGGEQEESASEHEDE